MKKISISLRKTFFPEVPEPVQAEIDRSSMHNLRTIAMVAAIMELLITVIAFLSDIGKGQYALVSYISTGSCGLISLLAYLIASKLRKAEKLNHSLVGFILCTFFVILTVWAAIVSHRHYLAGSDLLTFYTVMLCMACFVTFRPMTGTILMVLAYGGLYIYLYPIDGCKSLDIFNYAAVALISCVAVISRFFQQEHIAKINYELQENNLKLQFASTHDALTGLYNRSALADDTSGFFGKPLTVILTDIDYFKQINDSYGHTVGDAALVQVSRSLQDWFPQSRVYRYGGDEFLIVITDGDSDEIKKACEKYQSFAIPVQAGRLVVKLSFGVAGGCAEDADGFNELISEADEKLYIIKRQIHKDDASFDAMPL